MTSRKDIQAALTTPGTHMLATCDEIERYRAQNGYGIPWGIRQRAVEKLILAEYLQIAHLDPKLGPLYYFTADGIHWRMLTDQHSGSLSA